MTRNKMRPISPGEVLREQLEEIDMTATALATALDVPPNRITAILNEERSLTPDTALRLAKFFGSESSARFWLDLQTAYELRKAEIEAEKTNALRSVTPLKTRKVG
jgi:antitoxin HigA-1